MRGRGGHTLVDVGPLSLKGLPNPVNATRVEWRQQEGRPLTAVIADDAVLVREGVARLLEDSGITVVAQARDADELMEAVGRSRPDLVITDIRMPPTNTLEGLEAALRIRSEHPGVGVLVLSQHVGRSSARRLMNTADGYAKSGVGYLLKERVGDVEEFIDVVRRVAGGERVIDPDLSGQLVG
jgi:DNA-binding NarL/FixJ family response regulator